jgi:hypothetical protein
MSQQAIPQLAAINLDTKASTVDLEQMQLLKQALCKSSSPSSSHNLTGRHLR